MAAHLDVQIVHQLLAGQLPSDERARWLEHAAACARCRDMLDNERALMAVLDLGDASRPVDADEFSRRVQVAAVADRPARLAPLLAAVAAVAVLGVLLAWQLRQRPSRAAVLADELRISPTVQERTVSNLAALTVIQRDPWLCDEYEAAVTLERLITQAELP